MDYDEQSLNSMPTMVGGLNGRARSPSAPQGNASLGSAPTVRGRTTPPSERLRPGDVLLGRYTVLSELGEGGMGVVYRCLDKVGGIEVALKCLPPELTRNATEMEGIRENYAIVARLHHSAISGLRQLEKDPDFGEYYLVMDLAKGENLAAILRKRRGAPMPPDEALDILRPLASALDYAHGEHVLHRDVKPANVMVETLPAEARIRVQLLDFGLAAEVRSSMSRVSLRGHAGSSGTPAYMAPEQWEARRQSAATDQYSLAVMAYQMLSGYLPFEANNTELLKSAVLTRAPEEIEGVSPAVNAALLKALAKNPKERFESCAEFVESCFGPQRTQSPQRESHTGAQRHGGTVLGGATSPLPASPVRPEVPPRHAPDSAAQEAEVLRRKLALTRDLKAIPEAVRADAEFSKFVSTAEDEMAVAEEACKFGRFAAAAESLARAETALDELRKARLTRKEAERKAREEAERKAREERERKAREHGGVQLWAGGPYWAGTNVGAAKPEDYGLYFWWGDTVGYRREGDAWVASDGSSRNFKFSEENAPTFGRDDATLRHEGWTTSSGVLAPEHDAAHVHWGGGWRMPTRQELDDLGSKCDWTWTTVNGVNGYVVRGRGAYAGASIFLPAAGYGNGSSLYYAGSNGDYWSSVPDSDYDYYRSWSLGFYSGFHGTLDDNRYDGQSVRPVLGFAE